MPDGPSLTKIAAVRDTPLGPPGTLRVLVVEDNRGDFVLLRQLLGEIEGRKYSLDWVQTVDDAIAALERKSHDVAIVDFQLPSGSGLDVLREAAAIDWPAPVIMLTGSDDPEYDLQAMKLGAFDFIRKSERQTHSLERSIRYAVERKRMENVAKATNQELLGYIAALRDAKNEIERQRQRIVSLAYHLASSGIADEPSGIDRLFHRGSSLAAGLPRDELGIWSFDAAGRTIDANEVILSLFEIDEPERLLRAPLDCLVGEKGLQRLNDVMGELECSHQSTLELELVGQRSGRRSWVVMSVLAVGEGGDGRVFATSVVDVTTRRNVEESTRYLALHDSLTGLYNRAAFGEQMNQANAIAQRNGTRIAVLCLDLDGFKAVNDTWGHKAGDQILQETAKRLKAATRSSDSLARLGGDEFVVLATNLNRREDAEALAASLLESLSRPFDYRGTRIDCGISIGIALSPDDTADKEALIEFADIALYRAKAQRASCWRFFGDSARKGDGGPADAAGPASGSEP